MCISTRTCRKKNTSNKRFLDVPSFNHWIQMARIHWSLGVSQHFCHPNLDPRPSIDTPGTMPWKSSGNFRTCWSQVWPQWAWTAAAHACPFGRSLHERSRIWWVFPPRRRTHARWFFNGWNWQEWWIDMDWLYPYIYIYIHILYIYINK